MAPRRGGSGGSFGGSDDDDWDSDPWFLYVDNGSSSFSDRYTLASIIVQGIFLFALFCVAIAATVIKKNSPTAKAVFRKRIYALAITIALIAYGFQFAALFISAVGGGIQNIYFIFNAILQPLAYVAEILLLIAVHLLMVHQLIKAVPDRQYLWANLQKGMYAFSFVLFALWAAVMSLRIKYVVQAVTNNPTEWLYYSSLPKSYFQCSASYNILYMVASIEVMGLAILILLKAQSARIRAAIPILLISILSFPLMLRSVIEAAYSIRFGLQPHYISEPTAFAETFIYPFCTTLAFFAIVLISTFIERQHQESYYTNPPDAVSSDPTMWQKQMDTNVHDQPLPPYQPQQQQQPTGPIYQPQQFPMYPAPQQQQMAAPIYQLDSTHQQPAPGSPIYSQHQRGPSMSPPPQPASPVYQGHDPSMSPPPQPASPVGFQNRGQGFPPPQAAGAVYREQGPSMSPPPQAAGAGYQDRGPTMSPPLQTTSPVYQEQAGGTREFYGGKPRRGSA